MTKPIPHGTCQLSFNVPLRERFLLGEVAEAEGVSLAELWRRFSEHCLALRSPEMAERLRAIRREAAKVACLALALVAIGQSWVKDDDQIRRCHSRAQITRTKTVRRNGELVEVEVSEEEIG